MKNVDVPMWDKGDDTDDFSKGGSSSQLSFEPSAIKLPAIKEIFELVLGREPSSREMSYYKYSTLKKEQIVKKLLEGDEHKNILEKSNKFPELKEENKQYQSTVLKLKTTLEDKENEFLELKRLLVEKNNTIESLRQNRNTPFLTNENIFEENNVHYSIPKDSHVERKEKEGFLDRLLYLFFGER
jgi:hypothetical protein